MKIERGRSTGRQSDLEGFNQEASQPSSRGSAGQPVVKLRCAVYTRKSSEEGLEMQFNSLDAQRDAGEAYIASQKTKAVNNETAKMHSPVKNQICF